MGAEQPRRGAWPRNPVIYQIYPRSFCDSNGTGEGDLRGITGKLDHVASLGVDAIWLSPFFLSPMCDCGYDVEDHCAVDPRFGTLADFDALVARAHSLGLLVMIDQVFNHTSIAHRWFRKSLAGEEPYRDFYVWADPRPDGGPPCNWIGFFGTPAWRWHHRRRQYCLHQFLPCQPCLNHYCPELRARLREIMGFWRARGVDGFRLDAVTAFFHDRAFRDNPPARDAAGREKRPMNPFALQEHAHDMLPEDCAAFARDLRCWAGEDAYLLGEINGGDAGLCVVDKFTGAERLDAAYTVAWPESGAALDLLGQLTREGAPEAGLAWWLSSHDQPRHVSRAGDGSARDARMLAALMLALPGPILLFQGEEIGQRQTRLDVSQLHDPFDKAYWPDSPGRDGARCPLPWQQDAPQRGFTTGTPWLPVASAEDGPVAEQAAGAGSVLSFYQKAVALRRRLGLADAVMTVREARAEWILADLALPRGGGLVIAVNRADKGRALPEELQRRDPVLASRPVRDGVLPARSSAWWICDTAASSKK